MPLRLGRVRSAVPTTDVPPPARRQDGAPRLADLPADTVNQILGSLAPRDLRGLALAGREGRDFIQSAPVQAHFASKLGALAAPSKAELKAINKALPRETKTTEKVAGAVGAALGGLAVGLLTVGTLPVADAIYNYDYRTDQHGNTVFDNKAARIVQSSKTRAKQVVRHLVTKWGTARRTSKEARAVPVNVSAARAARLGEQILAATSGPRADITRCARLLQSWPASAPLSWYVSDADRGRITKALLTRANAVLKAPGAAQGDFMDFATAANTAMRDGPSADAALQSELQLLQVDILEKASLDQLTAMLQLPAFTETLHSRLFGLSRWDNDATLTTQEFQHHPGLVASFQSYLDSRLTARDSPAISSRKALIGHLIDRCDQSAIGTQLVQAAQAALTRDDGDTRTLKVLHDTHGCVADALRKTLLADLADQNWHRAQTVRRAGVPHTAFKDNHALRTQVYRALAKASERPNLPDLGRLETIVGIS